TPEPGKRFSLGARFVTRSRRFAGESPRDQRALPRSLGGSRGRRGDRRRRGGGAVQPAQARPPAGALRRLGAARTGRGVVPDLRRTGAVGPRRRGVLLRPGAG